MTRREALIALLCLPAMKPAGPTAAWSDIDAIVQRWRFRHVVSLSEGGADTANIDEVHRIKSPRLIRAHAAMLAELGL